MEIQTIEPRHVRRPNESGGPDDRDLVQAAYQAEKVQNALDALAHGKVVLHVDGSDLNAANMSADQLWAKLQRIGAWAGAGAKPGINEQLNRSFAVHLAAQ